MKIEQTVYEVLPAGQYPAKVVDVQEKQGNWGPFLKLMFEVEGGEHAGMTITGVASAKFSNRSKLYKWVRALYGQAIPKAYTLETSNLLGRHCILGLEVIEDDGTEFNRVESISPARKQQAAKPAAPAAPAPPPQDEAPWPDEAPAGLEEVDEIPW